MNILMPIYSCNPDGESESLTGYHWLSQISKRHRVFLITPARYQPALKKRINDNVIAHYVNVPEFGNLEVLGGLAPGYFVFLFKAFFAARKIIKEEKIDLIHRINPLAFRFPDLFVNFDLPCLIGPVGGGLKPLSEFPSVFKHENPIYLLRYLDGIRFYFDPWLLWTYKRAKKILVVGKYLYNIIPVRFHSKMQIYCESTINTSEYTCRLDRFNKQIKILYVGRFVPYKGANLLIRALYLLQTEHPALPFCATFVGGGGDYLLHCKALIKEFNLEDKVAFVGKIHRQQVIEYYQNHDIFCFPSLKETTGNVLLEAMSSGIPVIVADRGGPAEMVDEECGIKIPVKNEDDFIMQLKEAILRLAGDPQLRRYCAVNARKKMEEKFDINTIEEKISAIYEGIMR